MTYVFNYVPIDSVRIGDGSVNEISSIIPKEKNSRTIIVTGRSVSETAFYEGVFSKLVEIKQFKTISQHSPMEEINQISEEIKNKGIEFIISVGGGSVTDSVKVIRSIVSPEIKQIAVPTTLSAAEFSHIAGYTEDGEKKGVRDKALTPRYVFLDPNATLETPDTLWRSTGIRALDHAIESTLGNGFKDLRINFSRHAIEKLFGNLQGNWKDQRLECQIASWYSYMDVYDSEMGYSHLIGKVIGAKWKIPHGITSCITLPEVLRYYSLNPQKALAKLAGLFTGEKDESKAVEELADKVDQFITELGLRKKLSDYGIGENDLDFIMEKVGTTDHKFKEYLENML